MCYNGTFRFKKLDDSFWNGETFRFADYIFPTLCLSIDGIVQTAQANAECRQFVERCSEGTCRVPVTKTFINPLAEFQVNMLTS